jgi:hypothetical protein
MPGFLIFYPPLRYYYFLYKLFLYCFVTEILHIDYNIYNKAYKMAIFRFILSFY